MRKAFICHSSKDKEYARFVAKKLRRANVVFDEFSFDPGQDFRDEIIKHLDQSALFVFLASQQSIQSTWCKYEIDQAQLKRMDGGISGQLAIIIDPTVSFADLPNWMRNAKALVQTRPSQAVRDIQQSLFSVSLPGASKLFLGRQTLQTEFTDALATTAPHVFIINGLEGIGRRSYLERVSSDSLGLHLGPFFLVDDTHAIEDVYLQVLEETADIGTRKDLAAEAAKFGGLDVADQIREVSARLHALCQDRNLPCFVDRGGVLEDLGEYNETFALLMSEFLSSGEDHYLAFIHRRRPSLTNLPHRQAALGQTIPPLSLNDTKLLLVQLLKRNGISTDRAVTDDIAVMMGGYPPAAHFTATYSKLYGIDAVVSDRSVLADFKARNFSRFLSDLNLSDSSWLALQYLSSEVAVPLPAIAIALGKDAEVAAAIVRGLIDQSLVLVFGDSYALSPPIREAVERVKGYLSSEQYSRIADGLTKTFWSNEDVAPSLQVVDATLHAVARSDAPSLTKYADLVRPSTLHRLATECYHRKQWESALEYAKRVELMDPRRRDAWSIHFKALVQLERWDEAERVLRDIEGKRDRISYYLKGFMLRRRGKHADACRAFESALRSGDRANAVYRDYADSLYRLGRFDEAAEKVRVVLDRDPENIFILDLLARVYLDCGEVAEADDVVRLLERYDLSKRFIHHRKAALQSRRELWDLALIEAEAACSTGFSPFEAFAQRANILIELDRFDAAKSAIEELEKQFRTQGKDVRHGLSCKLLLREGRWREARTVWDQLSDKHRPVHRKLLLNIYSAMSADMSLSLSQRDDARRHHEQLEHELAGTPDDDLLRI
jgi:tetratricopeptide (TPR) repeat protein